MNFSSLSASDKQLAIAGGIVVLVSIISFVDPSGSWGGVMALSLLGGLFALFHLLQPQMAPTTKLPMTKGMSMLVAGALSVAGFAIAMLSYIGYISRNIGDIYVIVMIVGLVAAAFLAWTGWKAYQAEPKAAPTPAPPPAATEPPAAPPAA
jgi:threonine/homoserine/homoserine lactone efflux protein